MKPVSFNAKSRKNSREKEKKKAQNNDVGTSQNNVDKNSPTKESGARLYSGIDSESIQTYAEQVTSEHVSEEICNTLAEDINYKLRYIIHDAVVRARLSGKTYITSTEVEETFENLRIDKVFGATSDPNWQPLGNQDLHFLEENEVDLVEIFEKPPVFLQPGDIIIKKTFVPDAEISVALKNYFIAICEFVVSTEKNMRRYALYNIAENPRIFPIIEWFYNFAFILLGQDTGDNFYPALYVLDLILILECSQNCRLHAPEKQLRLLVRAILQRLIKMETEKKLLTPLCRALGVLCWRYPLKDFVIRKINEKFLEFYKEFPFEVLTIITYLGIYAVDGIFIPNMENIFPVQDLNLSYPILEIYNIFRIHYPEGNREVYEVFEENFGDCLTIFHRKHPDVENPTRNEINMVATRAQVIKNWKIFPKPLKKRVRFAIPIVHIFEMPTANSPLGRKVKQVEEESPAPAVRKFNKLVIGRTNLLLSVFKNKTKTNNTMCDSLLWYNL